MPSRKQIDDDVQVADVDALEVGDKHRHEELELQTLLRNAAFVVLLTTFVSIVLVVLVWPERPYDAVLLLGLATASVTSALALVGVQLYMNRGS